MNQCPYQSLLCAYHDRELDGDLRGVIDRHVATCEICSGALAELRDVTRRISAAVREFPEPRAALAAMHDAIDRAAGRVGGSRRAESWPLVRFVAPLAAMAASILIVGGVWLLDADRSAGVGGASGVATAEPAALAAAPDWERIAVTLRAEPRSEVIADSPFAPRYADAIDWMLDGLVPAANTANVPTEDKVWSLPKSF